jgi:hypothetical protein
MELRENGFWFSTGRPRAEVSRDGVFTNETRPSSVKEVGDNGRKEVKPES